MDSGVVDLRASTGSGAGKSKRRSAERARVSRVRDADDEEGFRGGRGDMRADAGDSGRCAGGRCAAARSAPRLATEEVELARWRPCSRIPASAADVAPWVIESLESCFTVGGEGACTSISGAGAWTLLCKGGSLCEAREARLDREFCRESGTASTQREECEPEWEMLVGARRSAAGVRAAECRERDLLLLGRWMWLPSLGPVSGLLFPPEDALLPLCWKLLFALCCLALLMAVMASLWGERGMGGRSLDASSTVGSFTWTCWCALAHEPILFSFLAGAVWLVS